MKKPIESIVRGTIEISSFQFSLEVTENVVWLSRTMRGVVSGLLGVSTGDIDVVVIDDFFVGRGRWVQVLEVSNKTGKFDGAQRIRLLFRLLPEEQARDLRPVTIDVSADDTVPCTVTVRDRFAGKEVLWQQSFARYSHRLTDPVRAADILTWHWTRYYRFLPWCDVEDLARDFGAEAVGLTLSEANRFASRQLYQRARDQGWHKLTLREQSRWGLKGQWHRDEDYVAAHAKVGEPNGASEATNRASRTNGRLDAYEDHQGHFTLS
ncbi:hypothetical protein M0R72_00670 [Candidatus Pacearchaeota archaeon]|jgi:hypothetical protein|nr:hypothetical protein [Candidatus Pacearchaeota archaeon]